jgi:hypothetical protein
MEKERNDMRNKLNDKEDIIERLNRDLQHLKADMKHNEE